MSSLEVAYIEIIFLLSNEMTVFGVDLVYFGNCKAVFRKVLLPLISFFIFSYCSFTNLKTTLNYIHSKMQIRGMLLILIETFIFVAYISLLSYEILIEKKHISLIQSFDQGYLVTL
jgi:hypothetical protein